MTAGRRFDVVIVGSGFAGSILARALERSGLRTVLIERGRHPRFALGESSTPLAAIALERLAATYDMPDLLDLAAHGRWLRERPELRRGLKRGFSFFGHRAERAYDNGAGNEARLLVAASPDDEIADVHWLRADVDQDLVRHAVDAGVTYLDETSVRRSSLGGSKVELEVERSGEVEQLTADFLVDASGAGGFLADALEIPQRLDAVPFSSRLVASHFEGVAPFAEIAARAGADTEGSPYPDDWAAVHHLTDVGWLYALRFDHGTTSAGFVLDDRRAARLGLANDARPEAVWQALLGCYPSLREQFAGAVPARPIQVSPRLQRRLATASGGNWALLPHSYAFFDPLFSTGIAWSLLGVERLAEILVQGPSAERLRDYESLLSDEADHICELVGEAYRRLSRFAAFTELAFVYFAAASFYEARQRLLPPPADSWAWEGFLGARDANVRLALDRLTASRSNGRRERQREVREAIEPFNLAGLADPSRRNLYPVDLEELVRSASLVGMSEQEMRAALPRLRGAASSAGI